MMKLARRAGRVIDNFNNILAVLAGLIIFFLIAVVTTEITLRAIWGKAIIWVLEVSGFGLLYITFLVAAWVLKSDGHIKIDLVLNRLSPRAQAMANTITSIVGLIICAIVFWYSARVTLEYFQLGVYESYAMLKPPKYLLVGIIPLGTLLLMIQFSRRTYAYLQEWKAGGVKKPEEISLSGIG